MHVKGYYSNEVIVIPTLYLLHILVAVCNESMLEQRQIIIFIRLIFVYVIFTLFFNIYSSLYSKGKVIQGLRINLPRK